jgi:hypothetical protein
MSKHWNVPRHPRQSHTGSTYLPVSSIPEPLLYAQLFMAPLVFPNHLYGQYICSTVTLAKIPKIMS